MLFIQALWRYDLIGQFVDYYDNDYYRKVKKGDIIAIHRNSIVIHYAYVYEVIQMHEPIPMCYHIHRISSGYRRSLLYKQPLLTILADRKNYPDVDINRVSNAQLTSPNILSRSFMCIDNQARYATRRNLIERSEISREKLHEILEAYYQRVQVFKYHVIRYNCEHLTTNWRYESKYPEKRKSKTWSKQAAVVSRLLLKHPVRNVKEISGACLFFPKINELQGDEILDSILNDPVPNTFIARPTKKKSFFAKLIDKEIETVEDENSDPSDYFSADEFSRPLLEELRMADLDKFDGTVLVLQSSKSKDRVSEYKRRQCYKPEHEIPIPTKKTTSYLRDIANINDVVALLERNPQITVFIWEKGFNCNMKSKWPENKYKIIGDALRDHCPNIEHISLMHYDKEVQLFDQFINTKNCSFLKCIDCPNIPLDLIKSCNKTLDFLGLDIQSNELMSSALDFGVTKLSSRFVRPKLIPEFVDLLCKKGTQITFLDVFAQYASEHVSELAEHLKSLEHVTLKGKPSKVLQRLDNFKQLRSLYWVADFGPDSDSCASLDSCDLDSSSIYGWPEIERDIAIKAIETVGIHLTSLQMKEMPMDMDFLNKVLKACPNLTVLRITLDWDRKGTKENQEMQFGPIITQLRDLTDLDLDGEWIAENNGLDLEVQLKGARNLRYIKVTCDLPGDNPNAIYNKIRFFCCFGLNEKLEIIYEKYETWERF